MKKIIFLICAVAVLFLVAPRLVQAEETEPVCVLQIRGTIGPAAARYISRGLDEARRLNASAVVIQLDTPGGMDGSMRAIVQEILNSPLPVIVYVAPQGARAASAGAFITLAAHLSAMAPGTNIGAAHPVQIGLGGSDEQKEDRPSVLQQKITNDAVAYIHSISDVRGKKPEQAEQIVKESRSLTAEEAKQREMVDFIAVDLRDLLRQAEGRQVKTVFGVTTLSLDGKPIRVLPMSFVESALHAMTHPTVAYLLFLLGIYGMIFELSTPGAVFPGVIGAIALVLALVAMETLQVNWGGVALIVLALLFFIADIKLPGYGALTIGGIAAFLMGSALLFPAAHLTGVALSWKLIGTATAVTALFFLFVVGAGIRALGKKVTSGAEGLIGAVGVAKTDLKPEGLVRIKGEEWQGRAREVLTKGTPVRVVKLEGLTVHVEPVREGL